MKRARRFGQATFIAWIFSVAPLHAAVAPPVDAAAQVVTIASDFVAPEAVAFDARTSSIVVADPGTGGIDRLAAGGTVSRVTLGGVGYRDGPVARASFDDPCAIAFAADGAIVVLDCGDRHIRRIANGVVTTIAAAATFAHPSDIVADAGGMLYVADTGTGIRVVTGDRVETLPLGDVAKDVAHLALWNGPSPSLFFVTPAGVGRIDLSKGTVAQPPLGGIEYAPAHIVALNATQFVAALPRYQALYFSTAGVRYGWWRRVAGSPGNDATIAGAFVEGPAESARFAQPRGMTLDADGNILLADEGNHRVRRIPAIDLRWDSSLTLADPDPAVYRIGFLSNSVAFYNTMWQDSIEGVLERRLATDAAAFRVEKPVRVRAMWIDSLEAQDQYLENSLAPGAFDCVIWAFDYSDFNERDRDWPFSLPAFDGPDGALRKAQIARGLAAFATAKIPVVLTDVPFGFEASPVENVAFREQYVAHATPANYEILQSPSQGYAFVRNMEAFLKSLGTPYVPSFDRILAYERGAHVPLYPPLDDHFAPAGDAFFAGLLADDIETSHLCDRTSLTRRR